MSCSNLVDSTIMLLRVLVKLLQIVNFAQKKINMFSKDKTVLKFFFVNIKVHRGVIKLGDFFRAFTAEILSLLSEFWDVIIFYYFLIALQIPHSFPFLIYFCIFFYDSLSKFPSKILSFIFPCDNLYYFLLGHDTVCFQKSLIFFWQMYHFKREREEGKER